MTTVREILEVLANIAKAYETNNLDDARPEWGNPIEKDREVVLVAGRGGGTLLTVGDVLDAKMLHDVWSLGKSPMSTSDTPVVVSTKGTL